MTASLERELGFMRASLDANTAVVGRLADKFDQHIREDDSRFAAIDRQQAESKGEQKARSRFSESARWAIATAAGFVAGMFGGHVPHIGH
jgi:hypothetical protein